MKIDWVVWGLVLGGIVGGITLITMALAPRAQAKTVPLITCSKCNYQGETGSTIGVFQLLVCIILFLCYFVPGLIYFYVLTKIQKPKCPKCGSLEVEKI